MAIEPYNDNFINDLRELTKKFSATIVMGIPERDGNKIYNSSALIDSGKIAGTYRKVNLWDKEKLLFDESSEGFPVFKTHFGLFGILICYDLWKVDVLKVYANAAVTLMAIPTNWVVVNKEGGQSKTNPVGLRLAQNNAKLQKVAYVCADRVGSENGIEFIGDSGIVSSNGDIIAGPASSDMEEIVCASIDL